MVTTPDGGGGSGGAFDGTQYDTNATWYQPGTLPEAGNVGDGPEGEGFWSAAWSGGGEVHGKVEDAMKAANPDGLKPKAKAWTDASTEISGYLTSLSSVWGTVKSAWSGDDYDQAHQIFSGLYKTLDDQYTNTSNMGAALDNMHSNLSSMKSTWGHDESTWGGVSNWASGDDDRASADDYRNMMKTFKSDMGLLPKHVPTQVKPSASPDYGNVDKPGTHAQGAGGAPAVGGAGGAPHTSAPTPAHIQQPTLHNQNTNHHPHIITEPPPPHHVDPTTTTDPTYTQNPAAYTPSDVGSPYHGGGSGIGLPGGSGAGLDTGGSLAGFDPSGAGGVGGLGAGTGAGGGLGAGAGGAGLSGLGAGAGAGAGGAGAGGLAGGGLAGGAGTGGAGMAGGASGAGGRGMMMPMHGAGDNDEDERERSTWLSEDDDVWGADDDVPGVIR